MREITNYQATNLRHLIESSPLTAREIAKSVGISESHMSRVVTGERRISERLAAKVSAALGVDIFVAFQLTDRSVSFPVRNRIEVAA